MIHPHTVILPQEQLDLSVTILSFVAFVYSADQPFVFGIPVVLFTL
ncbi:hypothetical protein H0178_35325 [Cytobacillus firmus]|nr:hypothetical protein [Cytobacillus firmus]